MIQSELKEAEKSEGGLRLPTPEMFAMSLSNDLAASTVIAIGRAQSKVGDKGAARATWQPDADRTADISSFRCAGGKGQAFRGDRPRPARSRRKSESESGTGPKKRKRDRSAMGFLGSGLLGVRPI